MEYKINIIDITSDEVIKETTVTADSTEEATQKANAIVDQYEDFPVCFSFPKNANGRTLKSRCEHCGRDTTESDCMCEWTLQEQLELQFYCPSCSKAIPSIGDTCPHCEEEIS